MLYAVDQPTLFDKMVTILIGGVIGVPNEHNPAFVNKHAQAIISNTIID